eukprot:CAMPEP_0205925536 /NCGR_PEP_ID=MMETSP1325-20131115/18416_1 /ASSEMBLY_ACC=CAM_ASM_000708 /TAXON_ID=236786 /ORGANISM="Florenciella sp., Strain RCC1007" /LENGTH=53 /DNA_ID=CAMNT_0053294079 /DNA_START=53 /DNA_END=210 /DNA_ORIENTATION=-
MDVPGCGVSLKNVAVLSDGSPPPPKSAGRNTDAPSAGSGLRDPLSRVVGAHPG